jgi:hypothetical protein
MIISCLFVLDSSSSRDRPSLQFVRAGASVPSHISAQVSQQGASRPYAATIKSNNTNTNSSNTNQRTNQKNEQTNNNSSARR